MLQSKLSLLVALCAVFVTVSGRRINLSDNYQVEVEIVGSGQNAKISLTLAVETTGFIGFGIGLTPTMNGSDLFIGGVNSTNGELYGKDYIGTGQEIPTEDEIQNWRVLVGTETIGVTGLKVERLLDTGDVSQDLRIMNGDMFVLWSYGDSDVISYHSQRGVRLLNLFTVDDSPATTTTTITTSPSTTTTQKPPTTRRLNLDANYTLDFVISENGPNGIIQILLKVVTTGYVGFGLSLNPNMIGADLFIGGFNLTTNQAFGKDYHSTNNTRPIEDSPNSQDWRVISGNEKDGTTTLQVVRNLNTNDTSEDIAISNSDIYVIWSYGENDTIGYHQGKRGARKVNLFTVDDTSGSGTTTGSLGASVFLLAVVTSVLYN